MLNVQKRNLQSLVLQKLVFDMATNYQLKSSRLLQNLFQYFLHKYVPSMCKALFYQHSHFHLLQADRPLEQFLLAHQLIQSHFHRNYLVTDLFFVLVQKSILLQR